MGDQVICFQVTGHTKLLRDLLFQLIHRVAGSQKLPRQRPTCHQWCRRCVRSHDTLTCWHVAQRCGVNIWLRDLIFVFEDDEKSNKESHDKRITVSNIPIYYHSILSIPSWSLVWDYACFQMMEKITSLGVRYRRGTGWSKWNLFGIHGVPRCFEGPS